MTLKAASTDKAVHLAALIVRSLSDSLKETRKSEEQPQAVIYGADGLATLTDVFPFAVVTINAQRIKDHVPGSLYSYNTPIYEIAVGLPSHINVNLTRILGAGGAETLEQRLGFAKAYIVNLSPKDPSRVLSGDFGAADNTLAWLTMGIKDCADNKFAMPTTLGTAPYVAVVGGQREVTLYKLSGETFAKMEGIFKKAGLSSIR